MNKTSVLLFLLILFFSTSEAQWHQSGYQLPGMNNESLLARIKKQNPDNVIHQQHCKKAPLSGPKTLVWKWDTITCYDTNGLMERLSQTFDINGYILSRVTEDWQGGAWANSGLNTYTYDINGNMLTETYQSWLGGLWENSWEDDFSYDINGNMLTDVFEIWQTGVWENNWKITHVYDIGGNMVINLSQSWQGGAWMNYGRDSCSYDINGHMIIDINQYWQSGTWMNSYWDTYTYNISGNMLTDLNKIWQLGAWDTLNNHTYTYDINGNPLTELVESWLSGAWVNSQEFIFTNDVNGNPVVETVELWQGGAWVNDMKLSYTYDINGNSVTGKYESWRNSIWHPDMSYLSIISNKIAIFWINDALYHYTAKYISYVITSDNHPSPAENSSMILYPNPADGLLNIDGAMAGSHIRVIDMLGHCLADWQTSNTKECMNLQDLDNGLYIVEIQQTGKISTHRIAVNH